MMVPQTCMCMAGVSVYTNPASMPDKRCMLTPEHRARPPTGGPTFRSRGYSITLLRMPRLFLIVSIIGALFTLTALRPPRRPEPVAVPLFFASWMTAELPYHHLFWQVVATAAFVAAGALRGPAGLAGLGVTALSWIGLLVLIRRSAATGAQFEAALRAGLGADYAEQIDAGRRARYEPAVRWRAVVAPLPVRDARVDKVRDIPFAERGGHTLRLDVYRPAAHTDRCPTLLYIHGGAWIIGDKREQAIPMLVHLAAHGWVCVTANHRLSPRATFPEHLIDVKEAVRWTREHIADYGGDPDVIVISGGSAGGHLAALAALTPNEARYQPGFEQVDTSLQGAVLWYGVYDLTNRLRTRRGGFVKFIERMVLKAKLVDHPEAFADASPMDRIRAEAPPTLVIHGSNDTLVPPREAAHFARLLSDVSTSPVVHVELNGAQHAFDLFRTVRTLHAIAGAERFCDYVLSRHEQRAQR